MQHQRVLSIPVLFLHKLLLCADRARSSPDIHVTAVEDPVGAPHQCHAAASIIDAIPLSCLKPVFCILSLQAASLLGLGLLYQGSCHRLMTETVLEEMCRTPGVNPHAAAAAGAGPAGGAGGAGVRVCGVTAGLL
jgi:hypothetical protein